MAAAVTSASRATGIEPLGPATDVRGEEALYLRNADRVFGFCLSRLGRREDAEDAVQTTFMHAVKSLRRGVVPLVESAWLLGIARNVCAERWEATGRRTRIEAVCDPADLERTSAALPTRYEELIGLDEALARLPEQQRRAVLLRDWRGLSYDEVAAQMGVSHAAVETLIFRGRRTLAAQLREGAQATRRRLASLANLGSLFTAVKTAFTGAAAATKIAAAVTTVVAVSGAGLAIGGDSPRNAKPEPQIRAQIPAPDLAPPVYRPDRITAVGPPTAVTPSTATRPSIPKAVAKRAVRVRGSEPLRSPRADRPAASASAPTAAAAAQPPAREPVEKTPVEKAPVQKAVDTVTGAVPPVAKQPVDQVVDAVLPPSVQTPVESVVDAVLPPAVQAPVESTVDTVEAAVPPVVPQAVDTVIEALPVEPADVVEELTDPLPPLPLLP